MLFYQFPFIHWVRQEVKRDEGMKGDELINVMSALWSHSLIQYNNVRSNTNNPMTKQM